MYSLPDNIRRLFEAGFSYSYDGEDRNQSFPEDPLADLATEASLYLRTAKLLAWRQECYDRNMTDAYIRTFENNASWRYGRPLPPVSKQNLFGIPSFSLTKQPGQHTFDDYVRLLLDDLFFHAHEKNISMGEVDYFFPRIAANIHPDNAHYIENAFAGFLDDKPNRLARLNQFTDANLRQHAFFDMDQEFVAMGVVQERIWKLYKASEFLGGTLSNDGEDFSAMHMALVGEKGKGKSTVIPHIATAMKILGVLGSDKVVSISLNKLAETILGGDDVKIREAFDDAKGGVLFIDEVDVIAGYLAKGHERSMLSQAINERMEEDREDTCVIVATYPGCIDTFLDSDEGLRGRFGDRVIYFGDYTTQDLVTIFERKMAQLGWHIADDSVRHDVWEYLSNLRKNDHKNFYNGRTVREFCQSLGAVLENRMSAQGLSGNYVASASDNPRDRLITVADIQATIASINFKKGGDKIDPHGEQNPYKAKAVRSGSDDGVVVALRKGQAIPGASGPEQA